MICNNCGSDIPNDSTQCQNCGQMVVNNQYKGKSSGVKILVICIIAILILSAVSLGAVKVLGVMESPKGLYTSAENKYIDDYIVQLDKVMEEPSESNFGMKVEIGDLPMDGSSGNSFQAAAIASLIENFNFNMNLKSDPAVEKQQYEIDLSMGDNSIVKATMLSEEEKVYMEVQELFESVVSFSPAGLVDLLSKMGVPNADSIDIDINSTKIKKMDKKDRDDIIKRYTNIYFDSIDQDKVVSEKGTKLNINNEDVACDKYTIKMDEEETKELIKKIYEEFLEDDVLIDYSYDNLKSLASNMSDSDEIGSKEEFKKEMKESKEEFYKAIDEIVLPDGIKMDIWVKSSLFGNPSIIARNIEISIDIEGSKVKVICDVKQWKDAKENKDMYDVKVSIMGENKGQKFDMAMILKGDMKIGEKVEFMDVSSKEVFDLDSASEEEIQQMLSEIGMNFQELIGVAMTQ